MKNIFYLVTIVFSLMSCSKDENIAVANPNNFQNLGLTANNTYPFWPNTWSAGLGDNMWFDYMRGDTLVVYRRDAITDDSGDDIIYTFLVKENSIAPLKVKRISTDVHIEPQRIGQIMYNKPIVNFRLQNYIKNKVLACEIETPNGDYYVQSTLIDKMWINLAD